MAKSNWGILRDFEKYNFSGEVVTIKPGLFIGIGEAFSVLTRRVENARKSSCRFGATDQ